MTKKTKVVNLIPALLTLLVVTHVTKAQNLKFSEGQLHGRPAYILENKMMRIGALRGAGHIVEIRLKSDDSRKSVTPMLVHHYPTIDPGDYDPTKHNVLYGTGSDRILTAGYMGHLLNFPTFGAPSDREAKNGLGVHGEALAVEWRKDKTEVGVDQIRLFYSCILYTSPSQRDRTRYHMPSSA